MFTKIFRASGATALAVLMASAIWASAIWSTPSAAAEFKLRYSDIGPPRGPRAEALKWWADELKTRSNGRIEIEFFWGRRACKCRVTAPVPHAVSNTAPPAGTSGRDARSAP